MIKYDGLIEKEIAGKKIFFRYNMATIIELGDMMDMGASDLIIQGSRAKLSLLTAFLLCGAIQYWKQEHKTQDSKNKDPFTYTLEDAIVWFKELGLQPVLEMYSTCFGAPKYEEKNEEATVNESGVLKMQENLQSSTVA
jgi:hypothetical protein